MHFSALYFQHILYQIQIRFLALLKWAAESSVDADDETDDGLADAVFHDIDETHVQTSRSASPEMCCPLVL